MQETPVLLITFNRPEHTKKVLEALLVQNPKLLYVFQDGPRVNNPSDEENCSKVRKIVEECTKGHGVELCTNYSETNRGCRDAIIFAISEVLKKHDSVIIVEDDIITSPAFLSFMNLALEYYKDRKTVFSISGYSYSPERFQVPGNYPYGVFASPRLFNWGWATWRDRWEQADWSFSYYDEFMKHTYEQKAFMRGGDDLLPMLVHERKGLSSAWDIQFAFTHFANHAVSIVPCISYTANIGQDGSGTHCLDIGEQKNRSGMELNQDPAPRLLDTLYFDSRIINALYSVFCAKKRPLWQKAFNFLARKLKRRPPFSVKKKVFDD